MSRETDSSYPRGNAPDEPKTEATLTTRIRINIPGSRPIPPVVMRKPVDESAEEPGNAQGTGDASGAVRDGTATAPDGTDGGSGARETSSWFAPRKPPAQPGDEPPEPHPAQEPGGRDLPPGEPGGAPRGAAPSLPGLDGPPAQPSGPTTGPATGGMPLLPPQFRDNGAAQQQPGPPAGQGPPAAAAPPPGDAYDGTPHGGGDAYERGPAEPFPQRVGDTAPGGIPVVPPRVPGGPSLTTPPGTGPYGDEAAPHGGPGPHGGPAEPPVRDDGAGPDDSPEPPAPAPAAAQRKPKKGRSKLVLLGVAVFGVLGTAYGAGLLLNHADVPNGTTVLGVDIGGTSQAEAVSTLERRLADRTSAPLTLDVAGTEHELKPSVAGLSLDVESTVAGVSGREYNPVAVISSLVGGERAAEPVFTVDDEKLRAALDDLTGGAGAERDGMVKFENGQAIAVPGQSREAVDPAESAAAVERAYRQRAETGNDAVVPLPVSEQSPKVTEQELQRAIEEFGEPAMSGLVTVRAGAAEISFSPERSLPKFLSMRPDADGTLVDHYDLKELEALYGGTFDGVTVARADGTRTPVTPQDVVGALRPALLETDPAQRVGVIELDPQ
ncbi:hypothetical protein V1J52_05940 [Streptomyces sp. TRM 70351]|uniref:hypothetical protein n=1 Tax=Streptomyces sp. TRM 70351 TaxID=3116552 RepID=UPI002E7AC2C6|nr:hypothetical protein [Streptomyces sp. TRM 70351]MEE1927736.1 hypothetical protein [Streptomyces sp. TRM 70351]